MNERRVLIVDDDAGIRAFLRRVFARRGWQCEEAEDGGVAIERFRAGRPPLTISNVKMPGVDGVEFLKAAHALDPTAAVVMLTGNGNVETGVECMRAGASDFLLKPVNITDLLSAAERALERRRVQLEHLERAAQLERRFDEVTRSLGRASQYDALTSLATRALFWDRLGRAQARSDRQGRPLALLLLNVDRFKAINETFGHDGGDQVLGAIGRRLLTCMRDVDSVGRTGGDEFAIIAEGLPRPEAAALVAERLLASFAAPFPVAGREVFLTTSAGIAVYPDDATDPAALVRNADAALLRAKHEGRNTYRFYTPDMNARALERRARGTDLRGAAERGEFVLYYQPRLELRTGRVTGAEALIRWVHPTRALVLPGEFIPLAEERGLIIPIGEWVLRTACAQSRAWRTAGLPPLRVAVNLSAREFRYAGLRDAVLRILADTGLAASWLELEVTEGVLMERGEVVTATLAALKAIGLALSIDDFGTGYSSLAYLRRFPVDALKIDQSFVHDLATDADAVAIATAIIVLARTLRLKVVAEGIETPEQLDILRSLGCDEGQGYVFSPPLPPDAFARWLAERAA